MTRARSISNASAGVREVVFLKAYHVRIPLKKTIRHASHTRAHSDNVVVQCRLNDGSIGYGEGVPREYVTGETIEKSLELLRQTDWSSQLSTIGSFAEAVEMARQFWLIPVPGDLRRCIGNAARCAAELALLDAFGRSFGVGLHTLASYLPECTDLYEPRPHCRYSGAITSKRTLRREILSAIKVYLNRFRHCKIKVGMEGQDDPRRLEIFRRILGPRKDFRIDANEAWGPQEVVDRILELEPFGITAVEQPVAHKDIACLAKVRQMINTPIMHDESLCSMTDAKQAVAEKTCDLFNIRLSKCGGLIPSMELAAFAHRNGLGYQLGCQIGETGILSAAGRHFGCSIKGIRYLEGSYDHFLVRERLTRQNLTFEWKGIAEALTDPGLGADIDPKRIQRVTIAEEILSS